MSDDDLATVVELACTVEDRTPREQRALIAVALGVDKRRGAFTTHNQAHACPPVLVERVLEGQEVGLSGQQAKQHAASVGRWRVCSCGVPAGAHTLSMKCSPTEPRSGT